MSGSGLWPRSAVLFSQRPDWDVECGCRLLLPRHQDPDNVQDCSGPFFMSVLSSDRSLQLSGAPRSYLHSWWLSNNKHISLLQFWLLGDKVGQVCVNNLLGQRKKRNTGARFAIGWVFSIITLTYILSETTVCEHLLGEGVCSKYSWTFGYLKSSVFYRSLKFGRFQYFNPDSFKLVLIH